jgi:hypothetical protein
MQSVIEVSDTYWPQPDIIPDLHLLQYDNVGERKWLL